MPKPPKHMRCSCGHSFTKSERAEAEAVVFGNGRPGWKSICSNCGSLVGKWDTESASAAKAPRTQARKDISREIEILREKYGFSNSLIARYLGIKPRTFHTWTKGVTAPEKVVRDIKRILSVIKILESKGYKPEHIEPWFLSRNEHLMNARPGDEIAKNYYIVRKAAKNA